MIKTHNYFGRSRSENIHDGEDVGFFYKRDIWVMMDGGHEWFSKDSYKPDFGAKLPRMCSWGLFRNRGIQNFFILYINTHLDNLSSQSRQKSCEMLVQIIITNLKSQPLLAQS